MHIQTDLKADLFNVFGVCDMHYNSDTKIAICPLTYSATSACTTRTYDVLARVLNEHL